MPRPRSSGWKWGKSVILPGVIPEADLPALYRCADGFCFPSVKEGWGLVVLEAIAAGLPVLVSDQPPFTEFLTPAQAVLVNPEDEAAIAAGLIELGHPQRSRDRIAQSQIVLDCYAWFALPVCTCKPMTSDWVRGEGKQRWG